MGFAQKIDVSWVSSEEGIRPLLAGRVSMEEALSMINKRYAPIGVQYSRNALYQKIRREKIEDIVEFNGDFYFRPETIHGLKMRAQNLSLPNGFTPRKITSDWDLKQLHKKFGDLLNTDGLIDEIERRTGRRYKRDTIKAKRQRRTLLSVGYTGTGTNRTYWYPKFQLDLIDLRPESKIERKKEEA